MDIKKILEAVEEKNLSIKDLNMEELIPNVVDNVLLCKPDGNIEAHLLTVMSGDRYKKWLKGRGGIFYKDLKKFNSNKPCGKYVLLEGDGYRSIARLIEEEEIELFGLLRLIDGKIKDKAYMNIRYLEDEELLTTTKRYIKENEEELIIESKTIAHDITSDNEKEEESEDSDPGNVSLFEEE